MVKRGSASRFLRVALAAIWITAWTGRVAEGQVAASTHECFESGWACSQVGGAIHEVDRTAILPALTAGRAPGQVTSTRTDFVVGVDVSFLPQLEATGAIFSDGGIAQDALVLFQSNGVNTVRIRLWHTPDPDVSGLAEVVALASRAKAMGLAFHLDIHYSDWWADPAHQRIPAAWDGLDYEVLVDSVYEYSRLVTEALVNAGATPDAVQLGNEIGGGMLWDVGRVNGAFNTADQWDKLVGLLNAGRDGVLAGLGGASTQFIVHISKGGTLADAQWFYGNLELRNFEYDIIGLTYYPWWQGTLSDLTETMDGLVSQFTKPVMVVETAYPWTLLSDDDTDNLVDSPAQLHSGYPASVTGQQDFLEEVIDRVVAVSGGQGLGVVYWAGDYTSSGPLGSFWENVALFDFDGDLLSSIAAFNSVPLPIVLSSFDAIVNGEEVLLEWTFADERDLASIGIEQLVGPEFRPVGSIDPVGRAGEPYRYSVRNLRKGRHTFRLALLNTDGTIAYSPSVEIALSIEAPFFVTDVYPNPSVSIASFEMFNRDAQEISVDVFTIAGRHVKKLFGQFVDAEATVKLQLSSGELSSGLYLVVVSGNDHRVVRKLVVL